MIANPAAVKDFALASLANANQLFAGTEQSQKSASTTELNKKIVHSAKLDVNDVSGAINSAIPLQITALSQDELTPLALKISGLPPAAYLTKGVQVNEGEWLLKAEDIAKAELVVPHSNASELGLVVTAMETKTGVEAAPSQQMHVALDLNAVPTPGVLPPPVNDKSDVRIIPVSALPDQGFNKPAELPNAVPPPLESLNPEARALLKKAETALKSGDIIAARQFFLRAHDLKEPEGAFGVGRTYDPAVFAELNVRGLPPDASKAAEWYGKAAATGHIASIAALEKLGLPSQP